MACFLVTGGAGFIGSHLVDALLDQGHAVRVLDDLSSGCCENLPSQIQFIHGDVTDPKAVERAFDGIDACFHLAAIASVVRSHSEWLRTHQVNLTGTINIFDQARRQRSCREIPIVYASTAAIYGDGGVVAVGEQRPAAPLSAYGADKRACELHARIAGAIHKIPTVGLRFFNLYGPRQNPHSPYSGAIAIFTDRLLRGEPIEIFGDGEQIRDFTYIGDAVAALCRAMPRATTSAAVFNVCTGKGTTVRALAETMAELYRTELVIYHRPARAPERCGFRSEIRVKLLNRSASRLTLRWPMVWRSRSMCPDAAWGSKRAWSPEPNRHHIRGMSGLSGNDRSRPARARASSRRNRPIALLC